LSVVAVGAAVKGLKAQAVALAAALGSTAVVRLDSRAKLSWGEHLAEEGAARRYQAAAKQAR
jgi:hypothetical protein